MYLVYVISVWEGKEKKGLEKEFLGIKRVRIDTLGTKNCILHVLCN